VALASSLAPNLSDKAVLREVLGTSDNDVLLAVSLRFIARLHKTKAIKP
jgi:hypothetical protein